MAARLVADETMHYTALTQALAPERPMPKHVSMHWAQRLKRVFAIDIEQSLSARTIRG